MNLKPTLHTVNGKIVVFYSPQQIEEIVPVTIRQPKQKDSGYYHAHHLSTGGNGIKLVRGTHD